MEIVNLELEKITCWFYTNKLPINVKRSNFIISRPRQNNQTLDVAFNISNYSIDRVKEATFLGVILDEHLHNVAQKVSKAVVKIYKSSFCPDNSSLRILYFGLIYPYLFYCVSVWASTYRASNLRRLITLQKRVIRIMSRSAFDAHTDPLFKNLKILNLESIYKLQIGKFMYQYRSGLFPYSFNNMFLVTHQVHSYGTRSSEFFFLFATMQDQYKKVLY